ncbi:MAG: hypothetical protein ACLVKR_09555 [Lachnospiraceae bacterium]
MNCYVIDIGTNSCRLMYAALNESGVSCFYKKVITARTGEGVNETKLLCKNAILRTVSAVCEFYHAAKLEDPHAKVYCFATSATRDAFNRDELLKAIQDKTGIIVDVLSGQTEAEIGFIGAVGMRHGGLLDIGGGSTEVAFGKGGERDYYKSFDIGAVRALDMFKQNVKKTIDYSASLFCALPCFDADFYACGGTCTTLAAMVQELKIYDPSKTNGFILKKQDVLSLFKRVLPMDIERRRMLPGLQPERADIIVHGMGILLAFFDSTNTQSVIVSEEDNMEGYLKYLVKNNLL